jgi:hypothetical protein
MNENLMEAIHVAYNEIKTDFRLLWENPDPVEEEFFYQFIIMTSFSINHLSSEVLSEFWTKLNTDYVIQYGEEDFYKIAASRDKRLEKYSMIYDLVLFTQEKTPGIIFDTIARPTSVQLFGEKVLEIVEGSYEASDTEADKVGQVLEKTLTAIDFINSVYTRYS